MEENHELNFNEIVNMIETRRNNAYKRVNEELISLYWDFGKNISEKVNDSNWGEKIVDKLAEFMKREYPTMKGFNKRGIYRMKQFYETYKDNEIVSPMVTQISWTNNIMILSSTQTMEEKEFYIRMCIKNSYSKRELNRQISSGYFYRYMLSDGKANQSMTKAVGEEDYPYQTSLNTDNNPVNTGTIGDEVCKIHDMASNAKEWTTEYCSYNYGGYAYPGTLRGGCAGDGGYYNAGSRGERSDGRITWEHNTKTFRPVLYF